MKIIYLSALLFCSLLAFAIPSYSAAEEEGMTVEEFVASLNFQQGATTLEDGLATLNLPESLNYLSQEDTERVLVDAWGNPPGSDTLGMVVSMSEGLFSDNGWSIIISYDEDGYVSDEDADKIDYDEMLVEMQNDSDAVNEERAKAGYEPIEMVGWASPPYYDKESHKLHWAKELKFGESEINTLNYNIRILGRKGVLILNIVTSMPMLRTVENEIPAILAMTDFNPGNKYEDFDPELDKVAAYGIGALVAGKLASKVGLLAKFGGILLALKKLWIAIPLVIAGFWKKFFKKEE